MILSLTKAIITLYVLGVVSMLFFSAFATVRTKLTPSQFKEVLGLIFMWPMTLLNEKMRLRLAHLLNPNR
jgi:F0F1-type ATP synthase membrane subunit a